MKTIKISNLQEGENVYVYTDNKGNKSAECPNCI